LVGKYLAFAAKTLAIVRKLLPQTIDVQVHTNQSNVTPTPAEAVHAKNNGAVQHDTELEPTRAGVNRIAARLNGHGGRRNGFLAPAGGG